MKKGLGIGIQDYRTQIIDSIAFLSEMISLHYHKKVILLIDE